MIQEFEEETYTEMLVDTQPIFNTSFLHNIAKEGIDEMLDKAVETVVSHGDLTGAGDQVHMDKVVETLDKSVEVRIHARYGDQVHMPLCQNVYTLMSIIYARRAKIYAHRSQLYFFYSNF